MLCFTSLQPLPSLSEGLLLKERKLLMSLSSWKVREPQNMSLTPTLRQVSVHYLCHRVGHTLPTLNTESHSYMLLFSLAVVALFGHTKRDNDELTFTKGDIIYVTGKPEKEWHEGVCNGTKGLFPVNYTKKERGKLATNVLCSPWHLCLQCWNCQKTSSHGQRHVERR